MSSASGGAAAAASSLSMRSTLSVSNKHLASCDLVLSKLKNSDLDKAMLLRTDATAAVTGTTDLVDRLHAAGLLAFTWTLRAENRFLARNLRRGSSLRDFGDWPAEFELILGTGVDGVFADQPDLVLSLVE